MSIVAETYNFVVGVDTHAATHRYAIVAAPTGQVIDEATFPTSQPGLRRAIDWIGRRTAGDIDSVLISAEGTGSYGAQMADMAAVQGYRVVDAPSPKRDRGADKNDPIDALKAARAVLARPTDRLADQRTGPLQEMLSVLLSARDHMTTEKTRAANALTALLRGHDLGIDARKALTLAQIRRVADWRRRSESQQLTIARTEAIRLAERVLVLTRDLAANFNQLNTIVTENAPALLTMFGVGPVTAAIILNVWSHPGRIHSEATLARLGGICPIETSSGANQGHRLNRGGNRQLNRAIHTIALTRKRGDAQTRDYVEKRTAEGMTPRKINRCLKRYITRQVHRTLTTTTT